MSGEVCFNMIKIMHVLSHSSLRYFCCDFDCIEFDMDLINLEERKHKFFEETKYFMALR